LVATTVGRVEVSRIAYRAPEACNLYPADASGSTFGGIGGKDVGGAAPAGS
jgi:hypothetical protein